MIGRSSNEVLNMSQRTVLQYLSLTDWKLVNRLPIPAGELIISRLAWLDRDTVREAKYGSATDDSGKPSDALAHSKHHSAVDLGLVGYDRTRRPPGILFTALNRQADRPPGLCG